MRIPLATSLESRDGTVGKDACVLNGIVEARGDGSAVRKRPGLSESGLIRAGVAQALGYWNDGVVAITDDYLNIGGIEPGFVASTMPSSANWKWVAYGAGTVVAIPNSGTAAAYSLDGGATWTASTLPASRTWNKVAYGNGVFVLVSENSRNVATSVDGITWSDNSNALPYGVEWRALCFNETDEVFLAIEGDESSSCTVCTSSDGVTWTEVGTMANNLSWFDVEWVPELSLYVAVSGSTNASSMSYSSTGASWSVATVSAGTPASQCVAWNGSILVATSYGTAYYYTSTNGTSWTRRDTPGGLTTFQYVEASGDLFVMHTYGAATFYTSTDGITWTAGSMPSSSNWYEIAATLPGQFVTVSQSSGTKGAKFYATYTSTAATNISPTTADLQFSMQDNGRNAPGGALLMFKNRQQGWYANSAGTVTQITDVDYPGTYAVTLTSLTRSGTTATATTPTDTNFQVGGSVTIAGVNEAGWNGAYTITGVTPSVTVAADNIAVTITRSGTTATATCVYEPHGFTNGQSVTISGAEQSEYNGTKTITWLSATTFSFTVTVSNSQVTTATGSPVMAGEAVNIRIADNLGTYGNTNDLTKIYVVPQYGNFFTTGESVTIQSNLYPGLNGTHTAGTVTTVGGLECNFEITVSGFATPIYAKANIGTISRTGASISSITLSNGVATVTTSSAHNLVTGSKVRISGCTQYYFNGLFTVTVTGSTTYTYNVSANISTESPATPATGTILARAADIVTGASFTFTVDGTETTPATGTITATSGRNTVPGIAYIDGYFVVMDVNGVIYNSALNDPSAWSALDYLTAQAETGAGKFLGRSQSYVVAFKEWSTEFFYNAGNEIGSPLSPVPNAFTQVGCASGESVAKVDGNLAWISQTREKGRSVHVMQGMQQAKVSTADVERILNADDLATVRAFGIKLDGHPLYLVTLVSSDITLVYDFAAQSWARWSSLTIGSSVSVSSITRSNSTATVTCAAAHGLSDGDPVKISGAGQAGYNGIFQVSRSSATVFTIEVDGSPTTPATGTIVCYPYTESYFKFTHAAAGGGYDYVLHESNGYSYVVDPDTYQDAGAPIDFFLRTQRLDGGESALKKMGRVVLVGDKQSDTAMIRWSDDDSATFSAYRRVTLSDDEPMLRRCGSFRRRSLEVMHIGNTTQRFAALEMEVSK